MNSKVFQLKLEVSWSKNCLGLAIMEVGMNQRYFLTPYYFWPKTEAWEQLKLELDAKLWLTKEQKINILKTTSNVMNFWLTYRNSNTSRDILKEFQDVEIISIN